MSLTFSQITGLIDSNVKSNSTSYPLATKTVDINLALDRALSIIFEVGGVWKFDDSNHAGHPIITTDIKSGQRDYSFTTDGAGNLVLDVYRAFITDSTGNKTEITPIDMFGKDAPSSYSDGLETGGIPNTYGKLGSSIFLDPVPNFDRDNALELYINREASYFTVSDTTKKPGIAGIFHEYLALRPSYYYALRNLGDSDALKWKREMLEMEEAIREHYKARSKDTVTRLQTPIKNTK